LGNANLGDLDRLTSSKKETLGSMILPAVLDFLSLLISGSTFSFSSLVLVNDRLFPFDFWF